MNNRLIARCLPCNQAIFWSFSLVLVCSLYPYDFFFIETFQTTTLELAISHFFQPDTIGLETLFNCLIFIPFGISLADSNRFSPSNYRIFFRLTVIAAILAFSIEALQEFLPGRNPSMMDLIFNIIGAILGFQIFKAHGLRVGFINSKFWIRSKPFPKWNLKLLFWTYLILVLITSNYLQIKTDHLWSPDNWDTTFPLVIGNEVTGDRPWQGEISINCMASHTVPLKIKDDFYDMQDNCLDSNKFSSLTRQEKTIDYRFDEAVDTSKLVNLKILKLNPKTIISTHNEWFQTAIPITQFTKDVIQSGQLGLQINLKTLQKNQAGPARIISISKSPYQRNFTVAQESHHLHLRIRTPLTGKNGTHVSFVIPNVFISDGFKSLSFNFDEKHIHIYIEPSHKTYEFQFNLANTLFWQASPLQKTETHLNRYNLIFHDILFYGLIFIPLAKLLVLIMRIPPPKNRLSFLSTALYVVMPSIILEVSLSFIEQREIQWLSFSISLITYSLAIAILSRGIQVQRV